MAEKQEKTERVFLVGVDLKKNGALEVDECMEELGELARTAGGLVVGEATQKLNRPQVATFIGKGKAEEIAHTAKLEHVDTVIFDDELSPAQTRNLERIFECKVLDRTSLILDIFAQRASTREGKMQIEMAQLQHILPRLTRMWTHLSRQKGGIGMRGDGESQLEVDRRRIQERISRLQRELREVKRVRATQRQGRKRNKWPLVSIVGYTNAGKSTLLNALTGADVVSEDKLFATLDPTTRRLELPGNQNALLCDTVGFIRKLPHQLVESFKATLEEVVVADILVHVVDVSSAITGEQIDAVNEVLVEIEAANKPTLMVFNKIDCLPERNGSLHWCHTYPHAVAISARTGEGIEKMRSELCTMLRPIRQQLRMKISAADGAAIARVKAVGQVEEEFYEEEWIHLQARIPEHHQAEFMRYVKGAEKGITGE